jgi:uncharacterized protein DUF4255/carboxypeptidase family protein
VIDDLDLSVKNLIELELGTPLPFDLSFAIPNKEFAPVSGARKTLNCYLYDLRENRELRTVAPYLTRHPNGQVERKYPPARVEASYCITAWSPLPAPMDPSQDEHKLLGDVLRALLRYPELPAAVLTGTLVGQQPPLPTVVIQPDATKIVNDFWTAIGGQLRPSLDYRITLSLDYLDLTSGAMVTTQISSFGDPGGGGVPDELIQIGGQVIDSAVPPNSLPNAWVRLDATGATAISDAEGRFIFQGLTRGVHVLRARATGFKDGVRTIQVPEPSGNYNVTLT